MYTSPCTQHLGCPPSTRKKLRAPLPCCSIKYVKRKYNYWLSGNIPHGIMRGAAFQEFRVSYIFCHAREQVSQQHHCKTCMQTDGGKRAIMEISFKRQNCAGTNRSSAKWSLRWSFIQIQKKQLPWRSSMEHGYFACYWGPSLGGAGCKSHLGLRNLNCTRFLTTAWISIPNCLLQADGSTFWVP